MGESFLILNILKVKKKYKFNGLKINVIRTCKKKLARGNKYRGYMSKKNKNKKKHTINLENYLNDHFQLGLTMGRCGDGFYLLQPRPAPR